jgi:ribokinase
VGAKIRGSLAHEGIDCAGVIVRREAVSQTAFIVVERESGRRTIFWRRPSGAPLAPAELAKGFLEGSDFLLLDGLMAEASLHAARQARERGVPVMLDAGKVRPGMLETARLCDYVVAGEQFAHDLGWDGRDASLAELAQRVTPGVLTVTLGARGSITCLRREIIRQPACTVAAVDTTGAGDVFHGGYVYGLLQGWELPATLRFASAMAALKCRKLGGRAGIPTLAEINEFLAGEGVASDGKPDSSR